MRPLVEYIMEAQWNWTLDKDAIIDGLKKELL